MIVLFLVFLRNLHTVFHHGYRNLPSHQQCIRISFSPDPGQYLFLVFSLITAILTGVRCYLTVVFIQISLMPSSSECLFMCLLVTCISSMGKCLFSSSAHFPIKLFAFLISNYMRCLYMLDINPLLITSFANIFFLVDSLFVLLMVSFAVQKLLSFSSVQSLSCVRLFATPWITARQASLSITNSWSSLRLTSIESVMPSSHLILCRPLLLQPPIPPSISLFQSVNSLH